MYYFRIFIVLDFTFRAVIHFELIFVMSDEIRLMFIFIAYGQPVVPAPFLKRLSFPHLQSLHQCQIIIWLCKCVPTSGFYSVPMIVSHCLIVALKYVFKSGCANPLTVFLIFQNCFGIRSYKLPYKFLKQLNNFFSNTAGNLMMIAFH